MEDIERGRTDKLGTQKILAAKEDERRKIAREIHDGPAQTLAVILLRLELLIAQSANEPGQIISELELLRKVSQDCLNEMRQILCELKPVFTRLSLSSALQGLFADNSSLYDFQVKYEARGTPRTYPVHIQVAVFRLVQEAVNNSRKHAGVEEASVILSEDEERIAIFIVDRGQGFELKKALGKENCLGIIGMQERVGLLGGTLHIESESGAGTKIYLEIPLKGDCYEEDKDIDCR